MNKITSSILISSLLLLGIVHSHSIAWAADGLMSGFGDVYELQNTAGVKSYSDPAEFIRAILSILLGLVAIVAAAAIVYAGFLMISDLGEEDNIKQGKQIIKWAIIGLIIIGLSAIVVNVVINQVVLGQGGAAGGGNGGGGDPDEDQ